MPRSLNGEPSFDGEPVYDLMTGEPLDMPAPPMPPGWHAVLDRRRGPRGQLLYYNEDTDVTTPIMPGSEAAPPAPPAPPIFEPADMEAGQSGAGSALLPPSQSAHPLAREFQLAGLTQPSQPGPKSALLWQLEQVEAQQNWKYQPDDRAGAGVHPFAEELNKIKRGEKLRRSLPKRAPTIASIKETAKAATAMQSSAPMWCCAICAFIGILLLVLAMGSHVEVESTG